MPAFHRVAADILVGGLTARADDRPARNLLAFLTPMVTKEGCGPKIDWSDAIAGTALVHEGGSSIPASPAPPLSRSSLRPNDGQSQMRTIVTTKSIGASV